MKFLINSLLNGFLIVTVFGTIACSHQRDINIDGGLSAENTDTEEVVPNQPEAKADAVAPEAVTAEEASPSEGQDTEDLSATSESKPSDGDDLMAALDGSTQEAMNAEPVATEEAPQDSMLVAQADPVMVAAGVAAEQQSEATMPIEDVRTEPRKKSHSPRPKHPTKTQAPKKESQHPNESSQNLNQPVTPQSRTEIEKPIAANVPPVKDFMEEAKEEQRAQEANAGGFSSFIEQHVFLFATLIMGSVIGIFFWARRKKSEDGLGL